MKHRQFAQMFNELRLKAGFESLSEFGKALAQEGYVYEDSTFSRWKTGTRIPRHPRLMGAIVKIFCEHQAFETKEQIIEFYESVGLVPPTYLYHSGNEHDTQIEELATFLLEAILGKPFVNLHHNQLKPHIELAHRDLLKFIHMLRAIQQNPQRYISVAHKYANIARDRYHAISAYIKKHDIVSKSDALVMVNHVDNQLSYTHATSAYLHRLMYR